MPSPLHAQTARIGWELRSYDANHHADLHRQVLADTFAIELKEADRWIDRAGAEKVRVLEANGEYAATGILMPMAQFFGGNSVRTRGISGVAVRPTHRRNGVGGLLIGEILREIEAGDEALSVLYASTTKLYRSVGYEIAGFHCAATLETSYLPAVHTALQIRELTNEDRPAMQEIVRANGRVTPGHMDRCDYLWPRIMRPR
ncbi:MAG: GNAT family N-acetyltransferase, partial [Planctomycetes bacterium]|nr:GNAT family N-acetyltransferase [Planctomycetota bacterium]